MKQSLSVVIPTYNRGSILLDTIQYLFRQSVLADEIIIVDQTAYETGDIIAEQLALLASKSRIQWLRKDEPSIPKAMNVGVLRAKSDWVLFIDDDVNFSDHFIEHHLDVISSSECFAHVGQIVQPWQEPNQFSNQRRRQRVGLLADLVFPFNSDAGSTINNCMAGNLCVNREATISAGGFDENFFGVAYRFETEFCKRFCKFHNTSFYYSPEPILDHLHIKSGGTRAHANHLTSASAAHSMGDYYFALLHGHAFETFIYISKRFFTCVVAKFYLLRPWYIPFRLLAECRGLLSALSAYRAGQALIVREQSDE